MNSVPSSHAAGRAAYARSSSVQEASTSPSAPDQTGETDASAKPQDTALQKSTESNLTAEEQQLIEENFPEDPELSMRLYGRGRGTETVGSSPVGGNLDVTG